jgi:glutaminyl-peptide cyclotransferase
MFLMSPEAFDIEVRSYELVDSYPHDPSAFTQGLVYVETPVHIPEDWEWDLLRTSEEVFYESTGLVNHSSLRCVHKVTGRILRQICVPAPHFAEGLAFVPHPNPLFFQLTWLTRTAFTYDGHSMSLLRQVRFNNEGWGATYDPLRNCIYTSDGTDCIRILDAKTFQMLDQVRVRMGGRSTSDRSRHIWYLNDLEMVPSADELWCNVFLTEYIAVVDVHTWTLKRWIDLAGLLQPEHQLIGHEVDVLNGLAWDPRRACMYVTGKRWPRIYAIRERHETTR